MKQKEIHNFVADLVRILQEKVKGEEKMKTLPKESKEYTKGQLYEAGYILDIIEKISRIKSYGIKGGKRVYVSYNDERKVENRQSKVSKRGLYYYAQKNNFSKKNTSLPEKFENLITCKDSEEFLKELETILQ